jgi:hypothetical protein
MIGEVFEALASPTGHHDGKGAMRQAADIAACRNRLLEWRLLKVFGHDSNHIMKVKVQTSLMKCCGYMFLLSMAGLVAFGSKHLAAAESAPNCLADGQGYFRARIAGSIVSELNWSNSGTACTGGVRPSGGARIRFAHPFGADGQRLVFVFGIPSLVEGKPGRNMPVNLTIIREGAGQFFGTAGDDKCAIDELHQEPIKGIPLRNRSYRVVARGFCMQPAPAVRGKGSVLVTRFDFSGRVDFNEQDTAELTDVPSGQ